MHLCLFEDTSVPHLRPLVDTRAAYDLRVAARTIRQTVIDTFDDGSSGGLLLHARPLVADLTAQRHPEAAVNRLPPSADVLFVNGRWLAADGPAADRIRQTVARERQPYVFTADDPDGREVVVAAWMPNASDRVPADALDRPALDALFENPPREALDLNAPDEPSVLIHRLWNLLDALDDTIRRDYRHLKGSYNLLTDVHDRTGTDVHPSVLSVRPEAIYLAPGATVKAGAVLSAEDGPIYIAEDATVHETAVVRGPCYVGPKSHVKVGADLQGSVLGYYCKVGGEVHGSLLHSLSNKGHAGYLGDSLLGRWCNLGADTNTSNLKNNYGAVTLYDAAADGFVDTGRQFLGLVMGDHAKCGINTMFNTGTVIGVSCNVYGGDFPPRALPAFSWGSPRDGFVDFRLDKAADVAARVMARRDRAFTDAHRAHFDALFTRTASERKAAFS